MTIDARDTLLIGILDDDVDQANQLRKILELEGYRARVHSEPATIWEFLETHGVHLLISDVCMPGMDGITLCAHVRQRYPEMPVILLTGYASIDSAKRALKSGAYDYLMKPLDTDEMLHSIAHASEGMRMKRENTSLKNQLKRQSARETPVGNATTWRHAFEIIKTAAVSDATVLILGESGTGKELAAQAVHRYSARAGGPLVTVHCTALPEQLLESELFGHEKGAFTGASSARRGRFEEAGGGTLFLDEIGEIPPAVQVKLLRVLQSRSFERLGSNGPRQADFRLVAATNRDLEAEVKAGNFREDLYYRLNVISVTLPALRERREDVPLLAQHFLNKFRLTCNKSIDGFTSEALALLTRYEFPGNVRELENIIERAVVLSCGRQIDVEDFPERMHRGASIRVEVGDDPLGHLWKGDWSLDRLEKHLLEQAMSRTRGVQTQAARLLGIGRRALQYRLEKHGLGR